MAPLARAEKLHSNRRSKAKVRYEKPLKRAVFLSFCIIGCAVDLEPMPIWLAGRRSIFVVTNSA
ncbi:hypothetical protein, partial [Pseudomonas viridiflava]|uniref:hypothetical protein n=1 Tax=Pseudomonas viridiflava TaxID=33069 RepID=UPI0019D15DE2